MDLLGKIPRWNFETSMVSHFFRHYAHDCQRAGEAQVLKLVRMGIERGCGHGYFTQREIGYYVNLMLMLGCDFDRDPQIPWALQQANDLAIEDPFERIQKLYQTTLQYLDEVYGPDSGYMARALIRIRDYDLASAPASTGEEREDALLALLEFFCPRKVARQGAECTRELIRQALDSARDYGIGSGKGFTVYVTLAFMLGIGFARDPMYAWAGGVLTDDAFRGEERRVERLHREAVSYVEHALSEPAA